jgi:hypothetical protein
MGLCLLFSAHAGEISWSASCTFLARRRGPPRPLRRENNAQFIGKHLVREIKIEETTSPREKQTERDASACIRMHQASAPPPAFNTGFDTVRLHRPTMSCPVPPAPALAPFCSLSARKAVASSSSRSDAAPLAWHQGLTLAHFSAQPEPFWSVSRFVSSL